MTGQDGEALELALGLLHAPTMRTALRRRPLPLGIGEVLAIASESSDAMREASARTGHYGPELVEASRFYIQQVLLADGADAYRNLGATPEAGHAELRDHHRLLLRWLHPDRSREDAQWDSALSTRVNQAWNQLRTPGARARYDAERSAAGLVDAEPAPVGEGLAPAGIPMPLTYTRIDAPEPIPTGPIAVAFLTLACLTLAWLAWTREDRLDELRDANRFQPPRVNVSERMAAPLPHVLPGVDVLAPAPAAIVQVPDAMQAALTAGAPAVPVADPDATPEQPAPGLPAWATEESDSPTSASAGPPTAPGATSTATAPSGPAATRATTPTTARPTALPVAAAMAAKAPARASSSPNPATPFPTAKDRTPDPVQLFHEAESAIANVTTWFAASSGHEPLWLDPQAAIGGHGARDGMRARQVLDARTRLAVDQPNWTLGTGSASMSGAYRLQGARGTLETGVLHVRLARRGDQWRVAGLQLEPAR